VIEPPGTFCLSTFHPNPQTAWGRALAVPISYTAPMSLLGWLGQGTLGSTNLDRQRLPRSDQLPKVLKSSLSLVTRASF
jgi:hypothetical protein